MIKNLANFQKKVGINFHNQKLLTKCFTHKSYKWNVYYYGNTDGSITNLKQEGTANHNAQITLTGAYMTTLNVLQQGSTNQSYNLTQNCQTVGGCTVNVTQN